MTIHSTNMSGMRRIGPIYYAQEDKLEFLNIMSKYKHFFEDNDFTVYDVTNKKDMWNLISQEYNDTCPTTGTRTVEQLRTLYKNMKRKARNDALREVEHFKAVQHKVYAVQPVQTIPQNDFMNQSSQHFNGNVEREKMIDHSYNLSMPPHGNDSNDIEHPSPTRTDPSTSAESRINQEEIQMSPAINLEATQSTEPKRRFKEHFTNRVIRVKQEPVPNSRRLLEEHHKFKLRIMKTELDAKTREAALNYEICLLQKEVAWKKRENATLEKNLKLEEMQEKRMLLKLQQENELLKQKLLKMELEKIQK